MLEAERYDNIDTVSPVFREIVDVYCGSPKNAVVTIFFTEYAGMIRTIKRKRLQTRLDRDRGNKDASVGCCIQTSYKDCVSPISSIQYRNFEMARSQLSGECVAANMVDWVFWCWLNDGSHKLFKEKYKHSSKRRKTGMDKNLIKTPMMKLGCSNHREKKVLICPNEWSLKCVSNNSTVLMSAGEAFKVIYLMESQKTSFGSGTVRTCHTSYSSTYLNPFLHLKKRGTQLSSYFCVTGSHVAAV